MTIKMFKYLKYFPSFNLKVGKSKQKTFFSTMMVMGPRHYLRKHRLLFHFILGFL